MLKALYTYISELGFFAVDLLKKLLLKIFRSFKSVFRPVFEDRKKQIKKAAVRACALLLVLAAIGGAGFKILAESRMVSAVEVSLAGEKIATLSSAAELDFAKTLVFNETGGTQSLNLTYTEVKTAAANIESADSTFEKIMKLAFPDYEKVCRISIGSEPLCCVTDVVSAKAVIEEVLADCKKEYPEATVSFSNEVTFDYTYKKTDSEEIWSAEKLRLMIKTLGLITPRHVECEKTLSALEYDTVEIETNQLFIGDSRVRREGQNGQEYVIDIVTYNGDKKVLSQHLTSLTVTQPVSQVIERGMRAESLSMGSYTVTQTKGYFCWPVVGLYQVTSEFGERDLGYHHGIDISGAGASGSLVVAGASGTVVAAGWSTTGFGNYVIIDHGNGIETLYGHMLDNSLSVSKGDTVYKGQAIGRVGDTGWSFGAHLHFEVRINGNRVNPARYIGLS